MRDRDMMILGFNAGAALSAFVAAGFWFISASGEMPKSNKNWSDFLDTPDAIVSALKYSAKWNRLAALFAGVSSLFIAAAISWGICF
jgi:urea transporter